ncbi:NADH-quinone oxidoreductase subunit NuoE [Methylococcus capsulatus]|jgi:NADH-quinone oxidoreductase subunit E|uniref:NADH-quinone oxidoreductase subunit NuoE n=1 Tax=Methylococcus capsulatus TaxID=414 RepID=UPI002FD9E725
MTLTSDEIQAILREAGHFPHPSAAAIEALNIVQHSHGWISDELLQEIAELLGMSPAELDSIATFYNLIYRRPVGRRVIHYCNSVSCWMLGAEDNRRHLSEKLGIAVGETTGNGEYTLLPIVCLGACDRAPVLMIGDETHFNVDPARLDDILGETGAP